MPVLDRSRSDHMIDRVRRTLAREGINGGDVVTEALVRAMAPRHERLDDDHDPRYLHPGRTVLVAVTDGGVRDPALLAAAALLDTLSPELRAGAAEGASGSFSDELPGPFDEDALEGLVVLEEPQLIVVLSEWLDQLRHLRHWTSPERVERAHRVTAEVHLPLAHRVGGTLPRRFDWWMRRVARTG